MAEPIKDLPEPQPGAVLTSSTTAINQIDLAQALEDGRITKQEVEDIWRETEWMSAQTPIEVRRAIVALKDAGHEVTGVDQVIMQAILDLRAALYRDESKFAHLVAGTETIVDKLQTINRWESLVERLETRLDETNLLVARMIELKDPPRKSLWRRIKEHFREDNEMIEAIEETAHQPEVEEDYDRKIGSNWDPNNPRKK